MDKILAIVGLRFKLSFRRMAGTSRVVNLIGGVLVWLFGAALAFGLAFGLGGLTYWAVGSTQQDILYSFLAAFWICALFGLILPLLRGAMDQGFDAAPFRVFPISRRRLFAVTLCAGFGSPEHVFYLPSLAAVTVVGILLPGIGPLTGPVLVLLLVVSLVVWSQLTVLALVRLMRARRAREFIGVALLFAVIAVAFAPALLDGWAEQPKQAVGSVTRRLGPLLQVAEFLPPTLAARGVAALHADGSGTGTALANVLALVAWNLLGVGLGYVVFSRYHLARGSGGAQRTRAAAPAAGRRGALTFDSALFFRLAPQTRAIAAKDLSYLMRSVNGRLNLVITPVAVLILSALVGDWIDEPVLGIDPERLVLFGLPLYAAMFSNNFLFNAFAWEGNGIAGYFTAPIAARQVLLGKNLAVWLYNLILIALVLVTWSAARRPPELPTLMTALLLFAAAIVILTACGNLVSVLFPVKRDLSSMTNSPSQVGLLLSIVALALSVVVVGPFVSIPILLGWRWRMVLTLMVLVAALGAAYRLALGPAADLLEGRKERLVETLKDAR